MLSTLVIDKKIGPKLWKIGENGPRFFLRQKTVKEQEKKFVS